MELSIRLKTVAEAVTREIVWQMLELTMDISRFIW